MIPPIKPMKTPVWPSKLKVKPTAKQIRAVDNILSGKFKSLKGAMEEAGYKSGTNEPSRVLLRSRGVEIYLAGLDKLARRRFGVHLQPLLMERYLDGIDATRMVRVGKNRSKLHPDFAVRKTYIDRLSEFLGWTQAPNTQAPGQQYNFFMFGKQEREDFNEKFKEFLKITAKEAA